MRTVDDKILIASELPTTLLEEFSPQTNYDFIIATMVLENEYYKQYFLNHKKPFTILDNGAFEKGKAIPEEDYLRVIDELEPDIIVLPDERTEKNITIKRSTNFIETYKNRFPINKFMGVVQGKSLQEWEEVLQIYKSFGIEFIGVPYGTNDRVEFIRRHPDTKFHALGLKYLPEIFSLRTLRNVVSVDTSLPVKFAYQGLTFTYNGADVLTIDERPELNESLTATQTQYLEWNLNFLKYVCNRQTCVFLATSSPSHLVGGAF